MKRLIGILTVFITGFATVNSYGASNIYVAPNARAGGNGEKGSPYRTLEQARDGIRTARASGALKKDSSVTIHLAPGIYRRESAFVLEAQDSGAADAPVVYRAQAPGQTRIRGGITLKPSSFTPVTDQGVRSRFALEARDQIRVCDLAPMMSEAFENFNTAFRGAPEGPWLYVNERPMTLARWPNADTANGGWARFSEVVDTGLPDPNAADPKRRTARPGSFVFDDNRPKRWNINEGVWLLGYWTHDWSDEVIRVAAYDPEEKVISLAAPHNYGILGGTWGNAERRFFAMNAMEELDAPGEWYLDRLNKRLYVYPEGAWANASIVLATQNEPFVRADGVQHVQFVNLTFECGHGDGLVIRNAEGVEIAGCSIQNLAGSGISIHGKDNTVRSCNLFHLGATGISLDGGDRRTLNPARNRAINNHIHHYGLFTRTYAPGIRANGCGQIAQNNLIHDAPHNAVLYGGNEHLFERNEIHHVVMETGDAGAFYSGRDWTSQGNILRHNYIHDLGSGDAKHVNTMGIYLDDCDSGETLEGNVFYRAGRAIMIGGGRDNIVRNNLVVDCPIGLHLDSRGMTWKQWNNPEHPSWMLEKKAEALNYKNPPWSERYPRLAAIMDESPREPLNNSILQNVFVDCARNVFDFDGNVKKLIAKIEIKDNLAVNTVGANGVANAGEYEGLKSLSGTEENPIDLGFADQGAQDFSLRKEARLSKELPSFQAIPFEKIGLFKDNYRESLEP